MTRTTTARDFDTDATWTIDDLAEAEGANTETARRMEREIMDDAWGADFDFDRYAAEFERRYDAGAF